MATWGYSLRRNNSCKTDENDCGLTWSTWHSCCPESSTCPTNPSRNNGVCCPYAGDGCSKFVTTSDPQCPEESANVFQNLELNATICCSNDTMGFYVEKLGFVGCAKDMALAASSNGKDQVRMMNILSPSTTSSTTSMYYVSLQCRSIMVSYSLTQFGIPSQQALLPRTQPPQE